MFKPLRAAIAIVLACFVGLVIPLPVHASIYHDSPNYTLATTGYEYNRFYFDDFTADYYLYRDDDGTSRMYVIEEFTAVFPESNQNHGITRVIPFTNNDGKNLTMVSDDTIYINVERNGVEEPISEVLIGDGYFEVYIGDASKYVHGEQVYTLEYEFENLILDFDDYQELYWDTNGNDWSQRFNSLTARVHLDDDIINDFTGETSCYVGKYGTSGTNRCTTTKIDDGVMFQTTKLSAGENLTFDLTFNKNTFKSAPKRYNYAMVIATIISAAGCVGILVFAWITCQKVGEKRRYYKGLFVKPEYTAPKGFTVAEMAANYSSTTSGNSKVATLLEMAVRHKIELVKTEVDGLFGKKKTEWVVRVLSPELTKEQIIVLQILAGNNLPIRVKQEIKITTRSSSSDLIALSKKFDTSVESSLKKKGLATAQSGKKKVHNYATTLVVASMVWTLFCIIGSGFLLDNEVSYITMLGSGYCMLAIVLMTVATFIISVIIGVKNSRFYTHTEKGLDYIRYLDGLKLYIKMAEKDRLAFLQSVDGADTTNQGIVKLYERLLPYAAIFKLEKTWLSEMGRYYEMNDVSAPNWYVGVGVFSAHEFAAAMNAASTAASSSISYSTSSGSSSGVSGFGGGGFSGGGGGGGGGGGW